MARALSGASRWYWKSRPRRYQLRASPGSSCVARSSATQLEPGDARNWYLLGRDFQYHLEAPDNARAIAAYRRALSFDPRSSAVWLDLAEAHEAQGDLASARQAFLEAERSYPISAEAAWR